MRPSGLQADDDHLGSKKLEFFEDQRPPDRAGLFDGVIGSRGGHRIPARARGDLSFVNYWPCR